MKKNNQSIIKLAILFIFSLILSVNTQADNSNGDINPKKIFFLKKNKFLIKEKSKHYKSLIQLPSNYYQDKKDYPVILFLHGAGKRGSILSGLKRTTFFKAMKKKNKDFIIIYPLCPEGSEWEHKKILPMMKDIFAKYNIDQKRLYLTGISMGAVGTYRIAYHYPKQVTAIVPISGKEKIEKAKRLKDTPVWAFHGKEDKVVDFASDQALINAINEAGGNAKLTVFEKEGHKIARDVYEKFDILSWFMLFSN